MNALGYIVYYLFIFIMIFIIVRVAGFIKSKLSKRKDEKSVQVRYIETRYNIVIRERLNKKLKIWFDLVNSFAATSPLFLIAVVDLKMNEFLQYALSVGVFLCLLLIGYNLIGIIAKKKES